MPLVPCLECGRSISDRAYACPHCGHPTGRSGSRPGMAYRGYEYRSKAEFLGLPLIHVSAGWDPVSGRRRIAKGIVAVGDIAVGGLAVGGVALGGIALGGLSVGLAALDGAAIGFLLGMGGFASGYVAMGGLAIGVYAMGGLALGAHTISAAGQDPAAVEVFRRLFGPAFDGLSQR